MSIGGNEKRTPLGVLFHMELRGIEPLSENPFIKASSITVCLFLFPQPAADKQAVSLLVASWFFSPLKALRRKFPVNLTPEPEQQEISGPTRRT